MEQAYWLSRKRASVQMARNADNSEARLVHYDLAGRYSVKAMSAGSVPVRPSVRCIRGPRSNLTHAMTAISSKRAAKTPNTFAASTIVSAPKRAILAVRHDRRR